jgi:hypothetical protein
MHSIVRIETDDIAIVRTSPTESVDLYRCTRILTGEPGAFRRALIARRLRLKGNTHSVFRKVFALAWRERLGFPRVFPLRLRAKGAIGAAAKVLARTSRPG